MRFSRVLRTGSEGTEQTYRLSQPCETIDVFLSHSWRDSGLLKYLAICLHFNSGMAIVAGIAASACMFYLQRYCGMQGLPFMPIVPFMNVVEDLHAGVRVAVKGASFDRSFDPEVYPWSVPGYHPLYAPSCQLAGSGVFLLVFLFGHHLRPPSRMFLDKICIHQTDEDKKAAGIQAIDQFIHRSTSMLIMYHDDYFERLWCCFELAARASEKAHLVMVPLWRAPCFLVIFVGFTIAHIAEYYCIVLYGVDPAPPSFYAVSMSFHLLPFIFMIECTLRAARQKMKLATALASFTVKNTKCFDPNDRLVVERAISNWFAEEGAARATKAGVDAKAIERFEADVRSGATHRQIKASIGSQPGLVRVHDHLLAGLMVWIPTIFDFTAHNTNNKGYASILIWNAPLFMCGFALTAHLGEAILRRAPRLPTWIVYILLFVVFMAVLFPGQVGTFVAQFYVCGDACVPV